MGSTPYGMFNVAIFKNSEEVVAKDDNGNVIKFPEGFSLQKAFDHINDQNNLGFNSSSSFTINEDSETQSYSDLGDISIQQDIVIYPTKRHRGGLR